MVTEHRGAGLLRRTTKIAGEDVASLSIDQLIAMKSDMEGQLASRRASIESARAETRDGFLESSEWHDYQSWRGSAVALLKRIEKEIALRNGERKALGGDHLQMIAGVASKILVDEILDGEAGLRIDEAAADAVRVARLAVTAVWGVLDAERQAP